MKSADVFARALAAVLGLTIATLTPAEEAPPMPSPFRPSVEAEAAAPLPAEIPAQPAPLQEASPPQATGAPTSEPSASPTGTGQVIVETPRPSPRPAEASDLISITLVDVELADVVQMFTRVAGANLIASPSNLVGRVTVNLSDVHWRPALDSILDMHGLAMIEKTPGSGVYLIQPRPPGAPEPMHVETFLLRYAAAETVEPVVKSMLAQGATMSRYPAKNALVVRSTAANLNDVRKLIEAIDTIRDQVFIEAKFMELNDEARRDLGVDWQVLQNYGLSAGSLLWSRQQAREWLWVNDDRLGRGDERRNVDELRRLHDMYNVQFENVDIEFVEPPSGGTYVTLVKKEPTRTVTDTITRYQSATADRQHQFQNTVSEARTAVLSADDFRIVLSALSQMNGVTVISNPKIIVANNQTARIHIGEKEPNIRGSVTPGQQGQANTTTYALDEKEPYFNFGITLDVTPTVNTASNITVDIVPRLTRFVRNKASPDGTTYPVTSTKEIATTFALESGRTAAIGGLTETSEREVEKKVPLLGDIPLIGKYLFTHQHREKVQQETVIFVTVALAPPGNILKETGLPEDTELVRRRLIQSAAQRQAQENELEKVREKAEKDAAEQGSRSRALWLRRRK